jgi:hypothetical protein
MDFEEMAQFLIPQLGEHRRVSENLRFHQSGVTSLGFDAAKQRKSLVIRPAGRLL